MDIDAKRKELRAQFEAAMAQANYLKGKLDLLDELSPATIEQGSTPVIKETP